MINQTLAKKFSQSRSSQHFQAVVLGQLAKTTRSTPIPANTVRRLPDILNRKERKTYLHFHFHTFTEDLTMGTAVLSSLLCSSRPFHSETVRQRSTAVLRQWQQEGLQQPTDRLVSLHFYISTEHSLNEYPFLIHLDERKIPGKASTTAKAINWPAWIFRSFTSYKNMQRASKRCQIHVIWLADCSTIVCVIINYLCSGWHV